MNEDVMNICMISDDKYSIHTGIALTSLKENKNKDSKYAIYILADEMTSENKSRLMQLDSEDFAINIIDISGFEGIKEQMVIKTISATPTALYKFKIPEILHDLDRVMYVDGDVLFVKDLKNLYFRDFCGKYAIVTPENEPDEGLSPSCKRLGICHKIYFCSGLMLLNIPLLLKEGIPDKLIEYRTNGVNFLMDQDAFNVVFDEKILCYNFIDFVPWYDVEDIKNIKKYNYKTRRQIVKHATILHICSGRKAWITKLPVITKMYLRYHKISPFSDIPINPTPYYKQFSMFMYERLEGKLLHKIYRKIRGKDV